MHTCVCACVYACARVDKCVYSITPWRNKWAGGRDRRDSQRETLNWSLSCSFLCYPLKKDCVYLCQCLPCAHRKHDLSPAGNRPFPPNRHQHNSQGWCECNDDTHKQLDAHTLLVSVCKNLFWLLRFCCSPETGFNHNQTELWVCNLNKY